MGAVVLASLVIVSASSQAAGVSRYPNSIAVLGHSGATGVNSDPNRPGVVVRENSWATGTNPAVKSVYLRILAKNPGIKGHNSNLAQGGATVRKLVNQATIAVPKLNPKPELILIQIMDADIVCPVVPSKLTAFRTTFVTALRALTRIVPKARIFVVSQFGSPDTYAKSVTADERKKFGGTGACDFSDPQGQVVPDKLARLDEAIHGYEEQLQAGCKQIAQCRYDGGAFGRIVDKREYVSSDLSHFSIKGHAQAAAVAWAAMQRAGVVPRG